MTPILAWCLREWRRGMRGSRWVLVSLAIGVAAMTAIGTTAASIRQALELDAREILGGDVAIELTSRTLSPQELERIAAYGTLGHTTTVRTMLHSQEKSTLVEAKAVDETYPLYGSLTIAGRGNVTGAEMSPESVMVDAEVLTRLGARVGERVRLGNSWLTVAGIIEKEPGRSLDLFTLGPRVILSRKALELTGLLVPGSLFQSTYALRLPDASRAEAVAHEIVAIGDSGWRVRPFTRASGRMETLLERLRTVSSFVALGILLVGGLGVASGVRAHMASRLLELAVWKALGASTRVLLVVHGGSVLLMGGLAIAAGVVLGACTPWLLAAWGVPVVVPGWYFSPMLLGATCGLCILAVFAALPLGRAVAVPAAVVFRQSARGVGFARKAPLWAWGTIVVGAAALAMVVLLLADRLRLGVWFVLGVGASFAVLWLAAMGVRAAARLGRSLPWPTWRLAMANMARPGASGPRLVLVLGLGLGMLGAVRLVTDSLGASLGEEIARQAPSFFVLDVPPHEEDHFRQVAHAAGAERVRLQPVVRGRITHIRGQEVETVPIAPEVQWAVRSDRMLTSALALPEGSTLVAGVWWTPNATVAEPRVSITADLAQGFGVQVGDRLRFNILGREVEASIMSVRQVDWTTLNLQFAIIFAPGVLEAAPRTLLGTIQAPPEAAETVFTAIARAFPQVAIVDVRRILAEVSTVVGRLGLAMALLGGLAVVVGLMVLMGSFAADQEARHFEAVVYKVCGATRLQTVRILAVEFVLAALVASGMAMGIATLASQAVVEGLLHLGFRWHAQQAVLIPLAGACLAVGLALRRTWNVLRLPAWRWLRND
ncbi:glycosyl transferase family 1 [Thermodesulfomicrobium sp. WS]|uniref:ABC transporter permease n=1 Tax=Thermodesulfomicrobium sp. WS TaxID=3004129 RepID=UPI0024907126|nr:ABC transporter permease [Thermodesulfomicrobium sp. WS]BDV01281.1 glycosyl transferase family 1 [Thermodesulfomicrobium sp. WS]